MKFFLCCLYLAVHIDRYVPFKHFNLNLSDFQDWIYTVRTSSLPFISYQLRYLFSFSYQRDSDFLTFDRWGLGLWGHALKLCNRFWSGLLFCWWSVLQLGKIGWFCLKEQNLYISSALIKLEEVILYSLCIFIRLWITD